MMFRPVLIVATLLLCLTGCASRPRSAKPSATESERNVRPRPQSAPASSFSKARDNSPVDEMTVNGDTVSSEDFRRDLRTQLLTGAESLSIDQYTEFVERLAGDWITGKIEEMLLYQRASMYHSQEFKDRIDKYVDSKLREIVTADYDGVERRYEKHLDSTGRTIADVRSELEREIIISSYMEVEIKPKVAEPTRSDLQAAFNANLDSWRTPQRRKMSLIDVRVSRERSRGVAYPAAPGDETQRAEARARIEDAQAELEGGADFADVVVRNSDGLHKSEGGSWGWVTRGMVRDRFNPAVEALYKLHAGGISEIIAGDDGFMLVRCDEIDPGSEPTFQEIQPKLKQRYTRMVYTRLIAEIVAELRNKARVDPGNLERFRAGLVMAALAREFQDGSHP